MYSLKLMPGWMIILIFIMISTACSQKRNFENPKGYNINNPQKFVMPVSLHEISGIAFYKGNPDTVYAEEDENGKLYYLPPGDKKASYYKFGKHGDYEDVAICNNTVLLLRSNGTLFSFPMSVIHQPEAEENDVTEWKDLLPKGEYESLYADEMSKRIYILCKNCQDEKDTKMANGYIFELGNDGKISQNGTFTIDVKEIEALTGEKKIRFHPSALAWNPRTNEWYIISSVNKLLVVTDSNWKVTATYRLNPALYIQPEGIAFDRNGNLYISNEGGDLHSGNILKTPFKGN